MRRFGKKWRACIRLIAAPMLADIKYKNLRLSKEFVMLTEIVRGCCDLSPDNQLLCIVSFRDFRDILKIRDASSQ